jgi:cellulose synthase/poly-beta-1,6-N-acetylglucosamine synthase-like glycosyltransferase
VSGPRVLEWVLGLAALPVACASAYLGLLAVVARRRLAPADAHAHRFDVIVPAHDEEGGITATVRSLLQVDYPADSFRVLVVADNCTDATAERARAAGARVLVRVDDARRGKGFALAHAYRVSVDAGFADAVVVVDADSVVTPNLLAAFSAHLGLGQEAMQAEYGVRNPSASWRTRLMVVALALFHTVRSRAREALGVSCGLRGNGMCFSTALLRRVPAAAFSIVEDIEYGIALGRAGVRVAYVEEASVLGEMPTRSRDSRSQRERWEGGRWSLARTYVPTLLRESFVRRDPVLLDLAADLLVPPLAVISLASGIGLVGAATAHLWGGASVVPLAMWSVSAGGIAVYVTRGALLAGGWRALRTLAWAPVYVAWKLTLWLRPTSGRGAWVRTIRYDDRSGAS